MASKRETLIASAEKSLAKGRVDGALSDYMKVLEETPGDIGILNKVGDLLVRLNRNDESIVYFNRIAEHYSHDGFYVKAIAMYKKVNRLDPSRLEVYERLAELYSKQGLGQEAKSQYQVLADHYLKQDNTGGAIAIFQKMVQADPTNIQLHVKLADLFTSGRRIPEALKEYAIVAGMLRDRSAHAEAAQVYEKALKLAPDNVEILRSLVPLLLETGNAAGARAVLRRALETTPRSIPLFLMAAEAALAANDLPDARNWVTKAQAVEPENEEVLNSVVKVQMKARRPDLAVPAASTLADLCVRRGEVKKAIGILAPIAKVAPDNLDLLKKVVDVLVRSGDEAATVPYRSAVAEICRREGRPADAAEQLRVCARLAPDNAEFRARLAALEPLLGAAPGAGAAGAPAPPPEEELHERAMTIPGDLLRPEFGLPPVEPPAPAPAPPAAAAAPEAAPPPPAARDEFEFDLDDESMAVPAPEAPVPAPPVAAAALPAQEAQEVPGGLDVVEEIEEAIEIPEEAPHVEAAPAARPWQALPPGEEFDFGGSLPMPAGLPGIAPQEQPAPVAPPAETVEAKEPAAPAPLVPPVAPVDAMQAIEAMEFLDASPDASGAVPAVAPLAPKDIEEMAVDEALVEADVFRKYGLLEKAVEKLKPLVRDYPGNVRCREKLFELLIEQGKIRAARKEAEALKLIFQADGREDRIRAMEGLLGEPLDMPQRPVPAQKLEVPDFSGTPPIRPVRPIRADEIDIPGLAPQGVPEPAPPRPPRQRSPSILEEGLAELHELVKASTARQAAAKAPKAVPPPPAKRKIAEVPPATAVPPVEAVPGIPPLPELPELPEAGEVPEALAAPALPAVPELPAPSAQAITEAVPRIEEPPAPSRAAPADEDLAEVDFCLEQGMVVDAAERLQSLEARFPGDPEILARRERLEGRGEAGDTRSPLTDLLAEDLESVLDAELGRALTDEMERGAVPAGGPAAPARQDINVDESGLFSDEQEFFNLAEELQAEMKPEPLPEEPAMSEGSAGISLEAIFREFKKGVEQQLSPEDHETHYNLGIAYKEMGLTDEAIGEFQVASKDPNHAVECCSMLGLCFLEKGLPQLAIKWYRKGLDTPGIQDDEKLGLQYDLASLHADLGDRDAAYKAFLEIYGTNASFRDVGDRLKELSAS